MNKLTKIIATIGPASDSPAQIEKLIKAGVNIFRFNFKHSSVEWHGERIKLVNEVAKKLDAHVGTLIDLQGPEIRILMPTDNMEIAKSELLLFGPEAMDGTEKGFTISHPDIIVHLKDGQQIIADDGAFSFVVEKDKKKTYLKAMNSGTLGNRKSMNIPGADFPFPVLIERDFDGLKLAALHEIDFVALSFVRSAEDLKVVRKEALKHGVKAQIVSKIETQKAIDHIDAIIDASDAIMVARGDLGVEMPVEQVPYYQKMIIHKCLLKNKPVITATQMLQSMIHAPYPTRAEVSDMANAVYDHTDCVMLSGETAQGDYPLETVQVMAKTVNFYETRASVDIRDEIEFTSSDTTEMICDSAYNLYLKYTEQQEKIAGFLVFSQSGKTARTLVRYRPKVPVFTFAPDKKLCDALSIHFGIYPFKFGVKKAAEVTSNELEEVYRYLMAEGYIHKKDKLIVVHGAQWGQGSGATTIRVIEYS
ncbi:MAG: pyruvate kinase [Weeksellaceae bacterium]